MTYTGTNAHACQSVDGSQIRSLREECSIAPHDSSSQRAIALPAAFSYGTDLTPQVRYQKLLRTSAEAWQARLDAWLTPSEQSELGRFRHPGRRHDWLSGRWCAKSLLADDPTSPRSFQQIAIHSRRTARYGCRPYVFQNGVPQDFSLSISHCHAVTIAAYARERTTRIGVDAVDRVRLPDSFARRWFSDAERRLLHCHPWSVHAAWAAKEATFKACNQGESFRPNVIEIVEVHGDSCRLTYRSAQSAQVRVVTFDDHVIAFAQTTVRDLPRNGNQLKSDDGCSTTESIFDQGQ